MSSQWAPNKLLPTNVTPALTTKPEPLLLMADIGTVRLSGSYHRFHRALALDDLFLESFHDGPYIS